MLANQSYGERLGVAKPCSHGVGQHSFPGHLYGLVYEVGPKLLIEAENVWGVTGRWVTFVPWLRDSLAHWRR